MPLAVDHAYVTRVLRNLVRIESVNPSLDPAGSGEREIAAYVVDEMSQLGLGVSVLARADGRPSIIASLQRGTSGPSIALNAHLDTVEVSRMLAPFAANVEDGRLYGRGAYDMKGGLAACMGAMKALKETDVAFNGVVELHAVADEEHSSMGTIAILEDRRVDAVIVTEPTGLKLCLAHKGFVWVDVETFGRAAHGSQWQEGVDANLLMGRFLTRLESACGELTTGPPHTLLGPASMHAAIVRGGVGRSTYAPSSVVEIERRTLPGESPLDVVAQIQAIVDALKDEDPTFEAAVNLVLVRPPFEARSDSTLARVLAKAFAEVTGAPPEISGEQPWMDASLYAAKGIDTVVFGPSGAGAHADDEWVDISSVSSLADCLAHAVAAYCGASHANQEHSI